MFDGGFSMNMWNMRQVKVVWTFWDVSGEIMVGNPCDHQGLRLSCADVTRKCTIICMGHHLYVCFLFIQILSFNQ